MLLYSILRKILHHKYGRRRDRGNPVKNYQTENKRTIGGYTSTGLKEKEGEKKSEIVSRVCRGDDVEDESARQIRMESYGGNSAVRLNDRHPDVDKGESSVIKQD